MPDAVGAGFKPLGSGSLGTRPDDRQDVCLVAHPGADYLYGELFAQFGFAAGAHVLEGLGAGVRSSLLDDPQYLRTGICVVIPVSGEHVLCFPLAFIEKDGIEEGT